MTMLKVSVVFPVSVIVSVNDAVKLSPAAITAPVMLLVNVPTDAPCVTLKLPVGDSPVLDNTTFNVLLSP